MSAIARTYTERKPESSIEERYCLSTIAKLLPLLLRVAESFRWAESVVVTFIEIVYSNFDAKVSPVTHILDRSADIEHSLVH